MLVSRNIAPVHVWLWKRLCFSIEQHLGQLWGLTILNPCVCGGGVLKRVELATFKTESQKGAVRGPTRGGAKGKELRPSAWQSRTACTHLATLNCSQAGICNLLTSPTCRRPLLIDSPFNGDRISILSLVLSFRVYPDCGRLPLCLRVPFGVRADQIYVALQVRGCGLLGWLSLCLARPRGSFGQVHPTALRSRHSYVAWF